MAVPCDACQRPVNELATKCPHCNAPRDNGAPRDQGLKGLRGVKLSPEEARALLVMSNPDAGAATRGVFANLVLPHPRTRGRARHAEIVLGALGFALVAVGAPMVLIANRRLRRLVRGPQGELVSVLAIMLVGAWPLWSLLGAIGLSGVASLVVVAAMLAALVVRALIRREADEDRSTALSRLDVPAPLPAAKVVAAPPPPPLPAAPGPLAPLAGASPDAPPRDEGEPGSEPRLLR